MISERALLTMRREFSRPDGLPVDISGVRISSGDVLVQYVENRLR